MRLKIQIGLALAVGLLLSTPALAHSGSGNPYIIINGAYAGSNPIYGINADLPQDLAPSNYAAGRALDISVDRNAFGSPDYQFRWTWAVGDAKTQEGDKFSHTYSNSQIGTQMITLEMRTAADQPYQIIDTIAINIAPKDIYKTVTAKVNVTQIGATPSGFNVKFEAVGQADSTANISSYSWKFGDGGSASGKVVTHNFEGNDFRIFPLLEIEDSNHVKTDTAFELDATSTGVTALDIQALPGVVKSSRVQSGSHRASGWALAAGAVAVAATLTILTWRYLTKRRGRTTKKRR